MSGLHLSEELTEDLEGHILRLSHRYSDDPQGWDWECVFCSSRSKSPEVKHDSDCFGQKMLDKLGENNG